MRRCSSAATPRSCAGWMCCTGCATSGVESLLVILGPSGAGKSSFLRAGLLPRLRRDDRRFLPLPIVRPERAVLTGELGLAHAIHQLRTDLGLRAADAGGDQERLPTPSMSSGCGAGWRRPARPPAPGCWMCPPSSPPPPWCCRWIRPRNCSTPTPGREAPRFLELLAALVAA